MAEVTLEGHGRPNVFLAGQVGQKYKDLDSGLEWVCTGERGFVKVDGDDQSEMHNWELVESGGSTGGGDNVFYLRFDIDEQDNIVLTTPTEECEAAYKAGKEIKAAIYANDTLMYRLDQCPHGTAGYYGIVPKDFSNGISSIWVLYLCEYSDGWKMETSTISATPDTP